MKKLIYAEVLTVSGKADFSGLYDENGVSVSVEMEQDDSGVTLTIWRNSPKREPSDCGISEEEIQRTCAMYEDCDECPLKDYCGEQLEVARKNKKASIRRLQAIKIYVILKV